MFADRESELSLLNSEVDRRGSSFVIIYGRRRIGKTTLIREFTRPRDSLYFLATEEGAEQNLKYFQQTAYEKTGLNILRPENAVTWEDIFEQLSSSPERAIIVIDEYQYLPMTSPGFSSKLQRIWDNTFKASNKMLILCGSLVSMMYSETLDHSSPLYGRRTAQIRLKQLPFSCFAEIFPDRTDEERLLIYALTGGVPRYAEIIEPHKSLRDNIMQNILRKGSYLYEEPVFLLSKELREIGTYFSVLKVISEGNHKLGDIAARLSVKQTSLSYYLRSLIDMDILEREVPVTEKNPEKSKKGLYTINDNFIQFWFRFVYPYRSQLEIEDTRSVMSKIDVNFIDNHVSFVYEQLCRELISNIASRGLIDEEIARVGKWWDANSEIDIVGINNQQEPALFGECKFTEKPIGSSELKTLEKKAAELSDKRKTFVLFSRSGFSPDLLEYSRTRDNILLFKLFERVV